MNLVKFFSLAILFTIIILPGPTSAQATCGNFIVDYGYGEELRPIENCSNPFNADSPDPFTYSLTLANQTIASGSTVVVNEGELVTASFTIDRANNYAFDPLTIFKKEGEDYRLISFGNYNPLQFNSLIAGEYVAVLVWEEAPIGIVKAEPTWKTFLKNLFLPATALAFYEDYQEVVAIPFSVEYETPEPTGASSVLFLPGIQASRLYFGDGVKVFDRLWEPSANDDVSLLAMDENGESSIDIRTNDVIEEAVIPWLGGNIYKGFIGFLNKMVSDQEMDRWIPFAYDWRHDVFDIVENGTKYLDGQIRNPVDELIELADSSKTGKVTIIAHSNGGLLAKAIIIELESRGRSDLVDKVIFIGTPHLGTPKAIATILHGYDQQKLGGLLIEDKVAREVMSNMPGAYGLLPSEKYLEKSAESIITFDEGESTQFLVNEYGTEVSDLGEYTDFLNGKDGRTNEYENISSPYTTNASILNNSFIYHKNQLDNWSAPAGIEVSNIIGVGLPTIESVEYRDVLEKISCVQNIFGQMICDDPIHFLRPYAYLTKYGDETVTALSSESVFGEQYYFDFEDYNKNLVNPFDSNEHANFTEVIEIQALVKNIINSTSTEINYIYSERPNLTQEYDVISIDSPVRIMVEDENGNKTGLNEGNGEVSIVQQIPKSQYFEFAGTKYLILLKDVDTEMSLFGEAYGSYSMKIATLTDSDEQILESEIINATTTPDMVARFSIVNGNYSDMSVDLDGDGEIDFKQTLDGEIISEPKDLYTYNDLKLAIKDLKLKHKYEKQLLAKAKLAELFSKRSEKIKIFSKLEGKTLNLILKTLNEYKKKGIISETDARLIEMIINKIK